MPLSELEKKWTGMDFNIAAEEMRRLKGEPTDEEKLNLYGIPLTMPLSELEKKWTGIDFNIAAEEMRRLKGEPADEEKLNLYGMINKPYMVIYHQRKTTKISERPTKDEVAIAKYNAWAARKGQSQASAREEYVKFAEKMIRRYRRNIIRNKWNSEVWTVDY
ncbi:acyl CoA binding protein [Oesophagostomum dentatum]|uniref:Acyl CoA binding protein n=1 Tax=Oesophagostomum dentatum TaxID=61180 RepID=A0A0B1TTT6_OESDE|nr:acyl CoA binding protein [Oesophagostomum dentatum]